MSDSVVNDLGSFLSICGPKHLRNAVLVTTWRSKVLRHEKAKMETNECNMRSKMVDKGCKYCRFKSSTEDGISIVAPVLSFQPDWIQIQRALGKGEVFVI